MEEETRQASTKGVRQLLVYEASLVCAALGEMLRELASAMPDEQRLYRGAFNAMVEACVLWKNVSAYVDQPEGGE